MKLFYDPARAEQFRQRGYRAPQSPETQAKVGLDAVEECARLRAQIARLRQVPEASEECAKLRAQVAQLRRDNQRLLEENARLRAQPAPQPRSQQIEVSRPWRGVSRGAPQADDVSSRFFGLLDK